jgi:hypothetical protein
MAIIYKAKVIGGVVDTVAIFDEGNVPDAFVDWVACDETVTAGWSYDGVDFIAPPPPPPPTSAELDALAERLAAETVESDAKFKVVATVLFQILKAQKTSDWTYFDSVTDAATFRELLKGLFRSDL